MPFCCRSSFLFFRCVGLRLAYVRSLLPRNFGRQSWRHARIGDDRGFCVRVSSTIILRGSKHLQELGGFFLRDEKTVVLPSHPLLVLNSRWGRAVISTYTLTCLFSSRSSMALASLGFCVIVPTVPSGFVDSPSLLQGKRCWFLVAFARRTDCGFAFTPTAGSQLSVGPRYDFDLHLYMFYLHLAVATFTRWLHGWLGTLRNRVSVVWFLCDRFFWFRRFTEFTSGQALLVFNGVWGNLTSCAPRA